MNKLTACILSLTLFLVSACSSSVEPESTQTLPNGYEATTTPTIVPQEGLDIGDIAPDFELVSADGEVYKLSDFRGQVVLLNFWATWCGYCREEMPMMQDMYEEYGNGGLAIFAVDVGETKAEVESFMQELGLTFPALLDQDKRVYRNYNKSNGIPQTYIIDKNGIIRDYVPGSFASLIRAKEVRDKVVELLGAEDD